MSEIKQIEPNNWETFLEEFSTRNRNRRARFDVFRSGGETEGEIRELRLENVSLKNAGNSKSVEIVRIDRTKNDERTTEEMTNVRGIAVQYDTDGSEDALEITDNQNTLVSMRMESKVDGVS